MNNAIIVPNTLGIWNSLFDPSEVIIKELRERVEALEDSKEEFVEDIANLRSTCDSLAESIAILTTNFQNLSAVSLDHETRIVALEQSVLHKNAYTYINDVKDYLYECGYDFIEKSDLIHFLKEYGDKKEIVITGACRQDEINEIAERVITENGCTGPCKGYYGYPAMTCVSVNNVLIHGIPSKKIILKEGDIVSLDVVACYKGYCADATRTFEVGVVPEKVKQLVKVTRESFFESIKYFKEGNHVGDISHAIEAYVNKFGYSVTRDATGHGIGSSMHEDPAVPCYGKEGSGLG